MSPIHASRRASSGAAGAWTQLVLENAETQQKSVPVARDYKFQYKVQNTNCAGLCMLSRCPDCRYMCVCNDASTVSCRWDGPHIPHCGDQCPERGSLMRMTMGGRKRCSINSTWQRFLSPLPVLLPKNCKAIHTQQQYRTAVPGMQYRTPSCVQYRTPVHRLQLLYIRTAVRNETAELTTDWISYFRKGSSYLYTNFRIFCFPAYILVCTYRSLTFLVLVSEYGVCPTRVLQVLLYAVSTSHVPSYIAVKVRATSSRATHGIQ